MQEMSLFVVIYCYILFCYYGNLVPMFCVLIYVSRPLEFNIPLRTTVPRDPPLFGDSLRLSNHRCMCVLICINVPFPMSNKMCP